MTAGRSAGVDRAARNGHVLVVGSLNTDRTVVVESLPRPGQTVSARRTFVSPGGKGANQAVAAARAGAEVVFVGAIGADDQGRSSLRRVSDAGVDVRWVVEEGDAATGSALVTVDAFGENTIVVDPGANAALSPDSLHAEQFEHAAVLLMALEVPDPVLVAAAREAMRRSIPVILNPSPLRALPDGLAGATAVLVVNEDEFAELAATTDRDSATLLAAAAALDIPVVIITLGDEGAIVIDRTAAECLMHVPSVPVVAVDTTGCGDAFAGALAAQLADGKPLPAALEYAVGYAALAATREGAQSSYPSDEEHRIWNRGR